MKTKYLKKVQRRINKVIRMLNDGIKEDDVFKGRFSAKQVDRKTVPYYDGSGFSFLSFVQFKDNETGFTDTVTIEALPIASGNRLFELKQLCSKFVKFALFSLQDCCVTEE